MFFNKNVFQNDFIIYDFFAYKVILNINIFKTIIKLRIFNQNYDILIIIKNNDNESENEIFEF